MNDIRLTKRGKVVIGVVIAALALAVYGMLLDAVTPDECKVPTDQMSDWCVSMIYER